MGEKADPIECKMQENSKAAYDPKSELSSHCFELQMKDVAREIGKPPMNDEVLTKKVNFDAASRLLTEISESHKGQNGDAHLSRALDLMSAEHQAAKQQQSIADAAQGISKEGMAPGQSWKANRMALEKAGMTDVPHGNAADIKSIPHMSRMPDGTPLQPGDVVTMGKPAPNGNSFIVGRDPESSKNVALGTSEGKIPDLKGKDVSIFRATAADALMQNAVDNAKAAIVDKASEAAHDGNHKGYAGKAVREALNAAGIEIPPTNSAEIKTPDNMVKLSADTDLKKGDVVVVGKRLGGSHQHDYGDSFIVGEDNKAYKTALGSYARKVPDLKEYEAEGRSVSVYRLKEQ
jgi:hypothetical protein